MMKKNTVNVASNVSLLSKVSVLLGFLSWFIIKDWGDGYDR